jgi:hypothetical protein
MALKFDNHIFYHIPKCGGTYVRNVLQNITPNITELGNAHYSPLRIGQRHDFENSFCVVRHPLDWYRSFFRYRIATSWRMGQNTKVYNDGPHPVDVHCHSESFEGFIAKMIAYCPNGWVTSLYLRFVPFCKYVLRQENLQDDLKKRLESWGYTFPKGIKQANVTQGGIDTSLSTERKGKILRVEAEIIKYLGYQNVI